MKHYIKDQFLFIVAVLAPWVFVWLISLISEYRRKKKKP